MSYAGVAGSAMRTVRSSTRVTWRGKSVGCTARFQPEGCEEAAVSPSMSLCANFCSSRGTHASLSSVSSRVSSRDESASSCSACRNSPDATATPRLASMARGGAMRLWLERSACGGKVTCSVSAAEMP